jgi:mono/diheme cytochrome c family protein
MKILAFVLLLALGAFVQPIAASVDPLVERGKYLVAFGSCNDCHTPGWRESDGGKRHTFGSCRTRFG